MKKNPEPPKVDRSRLKRKDGALLELLACFEHVFVYVDARREGVVVPKHIREKYKHHLPLQLGLNLAVPIRDLNVSEIGWSATMSFERTPFRVQIPWTAVYLITAGVGPDGFSVSDTKCMPDEFLVEQMQRADMLKKSHVEKDSPATKRKTLPPFLRVIEGGKKDDPEPGPHKPAV